MRTIRTPATFTIDPSRYCTTHQCGASEDILGNVMPTIGIAFDYALLAADLEVMGYPDELTEAIRALDPDHGGTVTVSFKAGDMLAPSAHPSASIYDHATQTWKPMIAVDVESTTDPDSEQQDGE